MLLTKREKSHSRSSKNAKYSNPKFRSMVRSASDMSIMKRRGRTLLTLCEWIQIIIYRQHYRQILDVFKLRNLRMKIGRKKYCNSNKNCSI